MFANYGLYFLFLSCYLIPSISPKEAQVPITTYRYDYDEMSRFLALMITGHRPPSHSFYTRYYRVNNIKCDSAKNFSFSIGPNLHYDCPKHDGISKRQINDTHGFNCPQLCEVCKNISRCAKRKSAAGIIYTPDGRKIDHITFHYGTLDRRLERNINWFIVTSYIFLFALFTNIVAYAFTS